MLIFNSIVIVMASTFLTAMPPEPSLEELCAGSAIVVSAKALNESPEVSPINVIGYKLIAFELVEIFKGASQLASLPPDFPHESSTCPPSKFCVLIVTSRSWGCYRVPKYRSGEKYLLFLGPPCNGAVYGRCSADSIWEERPCTDTLVSKVRSIVQNQTSIYLLRLSEGVDQSIPLKAIEHIMTLTDYDKANDYSKKAYYTIDGKKVGERGWWTTGKMAYECPMRDGRKHGLFRGWYPNGDLWQETYYLRGYNHGVIRQWDEQGKLSETFWLGGGNVTREAYDQECALDSALPRPKKTTTSQPAS